jgi:hypothetical protein
VERLNNVFGLGRWNLKHEIVRSGFDPKDNKENFILMSGELVLLDYDAKIPRQYGGHVVGRKGSDLADSYKSAVTDLLSKTASYIGVGIDVFKGKVDPRDPKRSLRWIRVKDKLADMKPYLNGDELKGATEAIEKDDIEAALRWIQAIEERFESEDITIFDEEELMREESEKEDDS